MFVYGTLKRGQPNHRLLQDTNKGVARFIGAATLVKRFPLVVASRWNIPFLLHAEGQGGVGHSRYWVKLHKRALTQHTVGTQRVKVLSTHTPLGDRVKVAYEH